MNTTDSNHELVHKVVIHDLDRYVAYLIPEVTAVCGKIWRPTSHYGRYLNKPHCPVCFPKESMFVWAT